MISLDCFLQDMENYPRPFVVKMILYALFPIIIFVLSSFIWSIVDLLRGKISALKNENIASLIIVLFLVHPDIVRISAFMF